MIFIKWPHRYFFNHKIETIEEVERGSNIPVFEGKRIVFVAGVGNKDEAYDESDIRQLTLMMQGMWRHQEGSKQTHLAQVHVSMNMIEQSSKGLPLCYGETPDHSSQGLHVVYAIIHVHKMSKERHKPKLDLFKWTISTQHALPT